MRSRDKRVRRGRSAPSSDFFLQNETWPTNEEALFASAADTMFDANAARPAPAHRAAHGDHKLAQLCTQVEEAPDCALAASNDPVLRNLCVAAVIPRRGSACLEVAMMPTDESHASSELLADDLLRHIERAKGYLRSEMAAAIHRKRAPELVFTVTVATDEDLAEWEGDDA
jgi:ribosome-binding factor A